MIFRRTFLAVSLFASTTAFAAKGDAEAGKAKSVVCQACHGVDGNGTGDGQYPRIAGQYADYLVRAITAYQSETARTDPAHSRENAIMRGFADTLQPQDIEDLAAYYSTQASPLHDLSHLD